MPDKITLENLAKSNVAAQNAQEEKTQEIAEITKQVEKITPAERQKIDEIKHNIDLMDSQTTEQLVLVLKRILLLSQRPFSVRSKVRMPDRSVTL